MEENLDHSQIDMLWKELAKKIARKILPKKVKKALKILMNSGLRGLFIAIKQHNEKKKIDSKTRFWKRRHGFHISPLAFGVTDSAYRMQKNYDFPKKIKFSIIVPPIQYTERFFASVGSI